MPKRHYKLATEEGAAFASRELNALHEQGDEAMLDLDEDRERALVAAGWLEPSKAKGKKEE